MNIRVNELQLIILRKADYNRYEIITVLIYYLWCLK